MTPTHGDSVLTGCIQGLPAFPAAVMMRMPCFSVLRREKRLAENQLEKRNRRGDENDVREDTKNKNKNIILIKQIISVVLRRVGRLISIFMQSFILIWV